MNGLVSAKTLMDDILKKLATGKYTLCSKCSAEFKEINDDGLCEDCAKLHEKQ